VEWLAVWCWDWCCGPCLIQDHVCGEFCDECLPGYYNLRADNPAGCDPCFCFDITDQCVGSTWGRDTVSAVFCLYVTSVFEWIYLLITWNAFFCRFECLWYWHWEDDIKGSLSLPSVFWWWMNQGWGWWVIFPWLESMLWVSSSAMTLMVGWRTGLWSRSRRLGLETVSRRINVSSPSRLDEKNCQHLGLVSVSAINVSCLRPIFRQILQVTIIKLIKSVVAVNKSLAELV